MATAPQTLWFVRVRKEERYFHGAPLRTKMPFGLTAAFASRAEAEAFQEQAEKQAAQAGDPGPLLDAGSLESLMRVSDFEPGVFRDWMTDHDIPVPAKFVRTRRLRETDQWVETDDWLEWLQGLSVQQLADLYAALHRFRFYEIVEAPFVPGDYQEEEWDEWEKNLPNHLPDLDDDDYDGYDEFEDGFVERSAMPTGWGTPPGLSGEPTPPTPTHPDDEIPF
jgi:hypothetical protein